MQRPPDGSSSRKFSPPFHTFLGDSFISRIRFLAVSRAFTIFKFYFDLLIWKGVWGLFDNVIGAPMPVSLAAMVVGMAVLAPLGAVRAIMCTPCGMGLDRPDTYVSVPMFLKVTSDYVA